MKKFIAQLVFTTSLSFVGSLSAQNISTVAGSITLGAGYSGDGGAATAAELFGPTGVAFDASGNMYIADYTNNVIREFDHTTGDISTVAGNYALGGSYSGDGSAATAAGLKNPAAVAIDASGNIIIADGGNHVLRKVDHTTKNISTIAGINSSGFSGDGGPATAAELYLPTSVALDASGNIYLSDYGNDIIRKIDAGTGNISTVAGNHSLGPGYSGDGGPATAAELNNPACVTLDHAGNIYFTEYNNSVVRKVDKSNGLISTIAGNHTMGTGFSGDGGPATMAELAHPWGVSVDGSGNLFFSDQFNNVIREVSSLGNINTIAGNYLDGFGYNGDGGPATAAELYSPAGVALDATGNLFIADNNNNLIREVNSVTIGIDGITLVNELNIYPNPSSGIFTVESSGVSGKSLIEVYNVFGGKVFETSLAQTTKGATNEINLTTLPSGIYFIQLVNQKGRISKRVVIEK
jgi:hypothetical protein